MAGTGIKLSLPHPMFPLSEQQPAFCACDRMATPEPEHKILQCSTESEEKIDLLVQGSTSLPPVICSIVANFFKNEISIVRFGFDCLCSVDHFPRRPRAMHTNIGCLKFFLLQTGAFLLFGNHVHYACYGPSACTEIVECKSGTTNGRRVSCAIRQNNSPECPVLIAHVLYCKHIRGLNFKTFSFLPISPDSDFIVVSSEINGQCMSTSLDPRAITSGFASNRVDVSNRRLDADCFLGEGVYNVNVGDVCYSESDITLMLHIAKSATSNINRQEGEPKRQVWEIEAVIRTLEFLKGAGEQGLRARCPKKPKKVPS